VPAGHLDAPQIVAAREGHAIALLRSARPDDFRDAGVSERYEEGAAMRSARRTVGDDPPNAGPALVALTAADLTAVGAELAAYHAHFAPLFVRREQRAWAAV